MHVILARAHARTRTHTRAHKHASAHTQKPLIVNDLLCSLRGFSGGFPSLQGFLRVEMIYQ